MVWTLHRIEVYRKILISSHIGTTEHSTSEYDETVIILGIRGVIFVLHDFYAIRRILCPEPLVFLLHHSYERVEFFGGEELTVILLMDDITGQFLRLLLLLRVRDLVCLGEAGDCRHLLGGRIVAGGGAAAPCAPSFWWRAASAHHPSRR